MRDPKRIRAFCNKLADIWETNCPDWRFGQLIVNVFATLGIDPFFPDDDAMIKHFEEYMDKAGYAPKQPKEVEPFEEDISDGAYD